jgi:lysophospholipase L1-like esterase
MGQEALLLLAMILCGTAYAQAPQASPQTDPDTTHCSHKKYHDWSFLAKIQQQSDWAFLCRYKSENAALKDRKPVRVVFMGDSITENWLYSDPSLFSDEAINRGISGQTTSQMLLRFYQDVVDIRPAIVHIMAGTNDVAQNTGPISDVDLLNNFRAMIDLATANHIGVILASIPPVASFKWRQEIQPVERILRLNQQLRQLATERHLTFVDYYSALKDNHGGLKDALSNDGVHLNRSGYATMRPLVDKALSETLHDYRAPK